MPSAPKATVEPGFATSFVVMRALDEEHRRLMRLSNDAAPRGSAISVGGGDWMDCFFRAEAIRGLLTALRHKKPMAAALADGQAVAEIAVQLWNGKREWQVHRSKCWIEDFLRERIRQARRKAGA